METSFICPICGNTDKKYLGIRGGKPYCRKCISFIAKDFDYIPHYPKKAPIKINYDLSNEQKELSKALVTNYKKGVNSFVHAVCGAGKTEIVLEAIKYAINCGDRVGFAIPRRDVVIEIYDRFKALFPRNKIVAVYGGHTNKLEGDLVVLTTHQLYNYPSYFDLLIIDEVDAFPFAGNELLDIFYHKSVKGSSILMSGTVTEDFMKKIKQDKFEILELFVRFHRHPLPVPKPVYKNTFILLITIVKKLKTMIQNKHQVFIFTPTISLCEKLYKLLTLIVKNGNYVHSKRRQREKIINQFKQGRYSYLVTTAVLERGVTVKGLQVLVFLADHPVYDSAMLTQIAGRVGRKIEEPTGEVIFYANNKTKEIDFSIEEIKRANKYLQNVF